MWLGLPSKYQTFWTKQAFSIDHHLNPDHMTSGHNLPFEYQTSPVFRWLLYFNLNPQNIFVFLSGIQYCLLNIFAGESVVRSQLDSVFDRGKTSRNFWSLRQSWSSQKDQGLRFCSLRRQKPGSCGSQRSPQVAWRGFGSLIQLTDNLLARSFTFILTK